MFWKLVVSQVGVHESRRGEGGGSGWHIRMQEDNARMFIGIYFYLIL